MTVAEAGCVGVPVRSPFAVSVKPAGSESPVVEIHQE
jgi:hypothetical protein